VSYNNDEVICYYSSRGKVRMPEKLQGPAGKVLLEASLPPEYRDPSRIWDAKTTKGLFTQIAIENPDIYPQVADSLKEVGRVGATYSGGYNYSLRDLIPPKEIEDYRQEVRNAVLDYYKKHGRMDTQDEKLGEAIYSITNKYMDRVTKSLEKSNNPVHRLVASGIKGNPTSIKRFLFAEGVYPDSWDRLIPWPVTHNFSTGMSPHEYWAMTYGSKKGIVTTKMAPGDAGFVYKQMAQAAHKLMVVSPDGKSVGKLRGMPVDVDDSDNVGAYLAAPVGGFKSGTLITTGVLNALKGKGIKKILVRSPISGGPPQGVYAYDIGARGGILPDVGTQVGLEAAQAIGERISQLAVGKKHQGMVAGGTGSATETIHKVLNPPRVFKNAAAHAEVDGMVTSIVKSPAGGYDVYIGNQKHYVPSVAELKVKVGDKVEAGDLLSTGIPNPAKFIEHKGIGEGRRAFVKAYTDTLRSFGYPVHRRNTELIARGLVNYVQFTDRFGNHYPGDVIEYSTLEHFWKPRKDARVVSLSNAKNYYLEEPVLHYSIGTRITPSVVKELQEYNIKEVLANDKPLPFKPLPVQAVEALGFDEDWLTRLLGGYQKRALQEAAAYGSVSDKYRTISYVPSLAEGVNFGKRWPNEAIKEVLREANQSR